jgi:hypothetical protein
MSLLVFGLWTVVIWTARITNVLGDDDLSGWGKAARVALALSFTVLGAVVLAMWWRTRRRPIVPAEASLVRVAAAWTVLVWVVRGIGIALGDHGGAFIAVHTVLAVVSIGLAVWAVRSGTLPRRHGTAGHRRPEANVA